MRMANWAGSLWAAGLVGLFVAVWLAAGVVTEFSRGWELAVTCFLPLLTLSLVIVIQHTQLHNNRSVMLKLDELIRSHDKASDDMLRLEKVSHDELEELEAEFDSKAGGPAGH